MLIAISAASKPSVCGKNTPPKRTTTCKARGSKPNSFAAGTTVLTRRGLIAIEEVQVGDEVLAFSEANGAARWQPVTERSSRWSPSGAIKLTLTAPDGTSETVTTTPNHPYLTNGDGLAHLVAHADGKDWRNAVDLTIDQKIRSVSGKELTVTGLALDAIPLRVYNFEVANDHTYAVGDLGAWVHNGRLGRAFRGAAVALMLALKICGFHRVLCDTASQHSAFSTSGTRTNSAPSTD